LQTEVIAIASRDRRDVQKTQKVLDLEFTLVPGPNVDLMKQYGAYNFQKGVALPITLIIDKNGGVRWKYEGKNDYDRPDMKKILTELRNLQ
jgi:peroxiredoxin